VTPSDLK
jgi:ubiquitin C-terminal hydrolase